MTTQEESLDFNDLYNGHIDIIDEIPNLDDYPTDDLDYYTNDDVDYTEGLDDIYNQYDDQDNQYDDQVEDLSNYDYDEESQTEPSDELSEELPDVQNIEDLDIEDIILGNIDFNDDYNEGLEYYPDYVDDTQIDVDELIDQEQDGEEEEVQEEQQEQEPSLDDLIDEMTPSEGFLPPPPPPRICVPKIEIPQVIDTCVVKESEPQCKGFREYDINSDTVGYQLRGNNHTLPVLQNLYRFRLLFTSADGNNYVPANVSDSINAISIKKVNTTPINPFGEILYYCSLQVIKKEHKPPANTLWTQCAVTLGYSFNNLGREYKLTKWKPLYVRCTPQKDGSAIIDDVTPYVQSLPRFSDGKIYIYLGIVYSDTQVELDNNHVVYYNDGSGIKVWTGKDCYTKLEIDEALSEKQDTLISGTNIKTINNESIIGSGNINTSEEIDIEDIKELWKQYIIHS